MPIDGLRDSQYRLLFSHPRMVRDLLRGFLREEWIHWLDPATLERRAAPLTPSRQDHLREAAVWRLRWEGGSAPVHLLLLPSREDDYYAAARVAARCGLLYEDLIRRREIPRRWLPVVLPVILYSGVTPWSAPREAFELFRPLPGSLQPYLPRIRYLVFDAAHDPIPWNAGDGNLVSLLCLLERSRSPLEAAAALERAAPLLAGEDDGLRQAWAGLAQARGLPVPAELRDGGVLA